MLPSRLATAAVLLAVCVAAMLYLPNFWWTALILPVLGMGAWEWGALSGLSRTGRGIFTIVACATSMIGARPIRISAWPIRPSGPGMRIDSVAPNAFV